MGAVLWLATRKGLFGWRSEDGGWRMAGSAFVGENCTAVLADARDGAVYAALDHGHFGCKLHRSRDGGQAFEEIAVPAYPPAPEGEEEWRDMLGRVVPSSLETIWCLEADHATRPGRLWCGTMPGGLFRSDDSGDSWSIVRSLWDDPRRRKWFGGGTDYPGVHTVSLRSDRPDHLLVAVSCGGVWESDDAGASFRCVGEGLRAAYMPPENAADPVVQDPHRIVSCPAAPERVWMQHHNGVFRSDDGGRSWAEIAPIAPSVFGFAVAVHPRDPDTAWFVPAVKDECRVPVDGRLVVTRTRDGGRSFEAFGDGLPGAHAYHLVLRHALDVDATGERLAFASTTGSLWISEDAGEHWRRLSAELPPVHAVRFAGA